MITPVEIYAEINSHPPLMQAEVQEQFLGQDIEWPLTFVSGTADKRGGAQLTFRFKPSHPRPFAGIYGEVPLSEYPWLKTLPADTPVRVKGRIRQVNELTIKLDILELSLQEPALR